MGFRNTQKSVVKITTQSLGDTVTYQMLPEATEKNINAIFDNAYIDVNGVNTLRPVANIDLADLPRLPSIKDKVIVESISYKVLEPRYDGIGGCLLVLHKV